MLSCCSSLEYVSVLTLQRERGIPAACYILPIRAGQSLVHSVHRFRPVAVHFRGFADVGHIKTDTRVIGHRTIPVAGADDTLGVIANHTADIVSATFDVTCGIASSNLVVVLSHHAAGIGITRNIVLRGDGTRGVAGADETLGVIANHTADIYAFHRGGRVAGGDEALVFSRYAAHIAITFHIARYRAILNGAHILSCYGTYIGISCYIHFVQF